MRKQFTTRFLESVTAHGSNRVEYFDMGEDGLMLRVSSEGTKSFAFRYRRKSDGRRKFVSLGHYPDVSLEAARLATTKARVVVAEGGDPANGVQLRKQHQPSKTSPRTGPTVTLSPTDRLGSAPTINRC
jgi:hypothetical protein